MTTPWQKHKAKWSNCQECDLCEMRKNVVLLRGDIPAQILFIGEAPGTSEDTLGRPFVGPAGQLLDRIIHSAFSEFSKPPTYALTNLVACIPVNENGKVEPTKQDIQACGERLREIVGIVNPALIVCVGSLSEKWITHNTLYYAATNDTPIVSVIHPAAILRMNVIQQPLAFKRAVVVISDAVQTTFDIR